MANLTRYGQSAQDKTYPDSDESVFGHMVLEMGMSPDEAVQNLRPWVRDLDRSAANSKNAAYIAAFVGAGAGLATAATMGIGLTAVLPIAAAAYNFVVGQQSAREQGIRESEYLLLKTCPELLKLIYALTKKGMPKEALVECYDDLLGAFTVQFQSRAQLGLSDELDHDIIRSFQRTVEEKCNSESLARSIVAETEGFVFDTLYQSTESLPSANDALPIATASRIGTNTKFGAIEVPTSPAGETRAPKPGLFDFNSLRTEPDNYTGFAIVGDMGTGKTRLIKYLARNILTTGRMSVMDIYARHDDWQGASVLTTVDDFLSEAVNELEEIDKLTEAYRNGQTVFHPHLFVVEEAADTLSEASDQGRGEAKIVARWLSKYLTITRKIGKRLCLVSVNIKDLTDAIGSAEKRNSMVFIFPGRAAIAKAMTDTYIFKLGTTENRELREKLEKSIALIKRPALIQHRGQWWVAEIPEVNEDGSLMDGSSPDIAATVQTTAPKTEARPKTASTAEDLNRMFNMPSAETEIEEDAIESASSLSSIQSAFHNWKPKSQDIAAKIVDWMAGRADKTFAPSEVKKSIRLLKDDATLTADRLKKLLDLLTEKQFLSCDETGRYAIAQSTQQTDDYDF